LLNYFLPTVSILYYFLPIAYVHALYIFQNVIFSITYHVSISSSSSSILLTCLGRPKIICPAFPRSAFLANNFHCERELASRQTPNLEYQDLSVVISPILIAFITAKDSRLASSYPCGRGPRQLLPPGPGGPVAHDGRGATP